MERKQFLRNTAALVGAGVVGARGVAQAQSAAPDVPFTDTLANGDRVVTADGAASLWDIEGIYDAVTGMEIEHVWMLNWDAPWADHYTGPPDRFTLERARRPFVLRLKDGRTYRSAG